MLRRTAIVCALLVIAGALGLEGRREPGLKLHLINGHPIVEGVFVNGSGPYRFLVDTGSTLNHFDSKIARKVGLKAAYRANVVSANGANVVPGAHGIEISADSARATKQLVLLGGLDAVQLLSRDIQGVLGQSFLAEFDYMLDMHAKRLVFGRRDCTGTRVPILFVDGRPTIDTNLGRLLLDSGAHNLVLFNVPTTTATREIVTLAGARRAGTAPRELRIDGRVFWRGEILGIPFDDAGFAGLQPTNLFKKVYVSNSEGYIVLN